MKTIATDLNTPLGLKGGSAIGRVLVGDPEDESLGRTQQQGDEPGDHDHLFIY